jgi:hypothetical protein
VNSSDRHHGAEIATKLGPAAPARAIDFKLTPFNRQDRYSFTVYVVSLDKGHPGGIRLSSQEPVNFKGGPRISEKTSAKAAEVAGALISEIVRRY